tara:strand:+ start:163 stop:408 length:246 start_codon:yes stop_codon:yes gene_type:complete
MTSKREKILAALKAGEELTAKQMARRFGAGDAVREVNRLRHEGYAIYLNSYANSKGVTKKFRLGTPTRAVVAAGYQALSAA